MADIDNSSVNKKIIRTLEFDFYGGVIFNGKGDESGRSLAMSHAC